MAKFVHDDALDALLDVIATADKLTICEGQPATYAEATTLKGSGGKKLGEIAVDSGDFTKANGDTNGRKITVGQQTGISISVTGDGDHVALVDDALSKLLFVTTFTLQNMTAGNTATVNAFKDEVADAA